MASLSSPLTRICRILAVLLPVALTHSRALAEIDLDLLAIGLLLRSGFSRFSPSGRPDWAWARSFWFVPVLLWWGWQVLATVVAAIQSGAGAEPVLLFRALVAIRIPLAAAALGVWLLRDRVWQKRVIAVSVAALLYIAFQAAFQAVFGVNLFGDPRYFDGTLTGPYRHPMAAAPMSRLFPLALMVLLGWAVSRGKAAQGRLRGLGLVALVGGIILSVVIMVLAGQRMPTVLYALGLLICGLLVPRFRFALGIALVSVLPFVANLGRVAPESFRHLVALTRVQVHAGVDSPYGHVFLRALHIGARSPIFGEGYEGYRRLCRMPLPLDAPGTVGRWLPSLPPGLEQCSNHPHNHYLQALVNGGIPGLVLFAVMIVCFLRAIWPGWRAEPVRAGLFAGVLLQEWPVASTSDFFNLPLGGWAFLLLGLGLARRPAEDKMSVQVGFPEAKERR